ncbi:MAG: RloB domain-containing protein [Sphaerochaeta sp.]|nr:RloB domain-containing protein [Sphaerochaeta sp.]
MARKSKKILPVRTILVVTEGSSEKIYFTSLRDAFKVPGLTIIPKEAKHSSLQYVLEKAMCEKLTGAYESVWVVYDRDTQHSDSAKVKTLLKKARKQGIKMADSLPCFEVWLLAHFTLPKATYHNQAAVIDELRMFHSTYVKNQEQQKRQDLFMEYHPHLPTAKKNASQLERQAGSDIDKTKTLIPNLLLDITKEV